MCPPLLLFLGWEWEQQCNTVTTFKDRPVHLFCNCLKTNHKKLKRKKDVSVHFPQVHIQQRQHRATWCRYVLLLLHWTVTLTAEHVNRPRLVNCSTRVMLQCNHFLEACCCAISHADQDMSHKEGKWENGVPPPRARHLPPACLTGDTLCSYAEQTGCECL